MLTLLHASWAEGMIADLQQQKQGDLYFLILKCSSVCYWIFYHLDNLPSVQNF